MLYLSLFIYLVTVCYFCYIFGKVVYFDPPATWIEKILSGIFLCIGVAGVLGAHNILKLVVNS